MSRTIYTWTKTDPPATTTPKTLKLLTTQTLFTLTSRFHFTKALYHKLKNTCRLCHLYLKNAKPIHKKLRFVFRQYFAAFSHEGAIAKTGKGASRHLRGTASGGG